MSWFTISPHLCLDEAFDAPDTEADYELCRAIVAGKAGLHPDAWGNHDPLPLRWLLRARPDVPVPARVKPTPPPWAWAQPWRQPPEVPGGTWVEDKAGDVQLTCDECGQRYRHTLPYSAGQRPAAVAAIRQLASCVGWTCIVGRDRCPACSALQPAAPEPVGNGAGKHDRHE